MCFGPRQQWCLSANDDLLNTCDPRHKFWLISFYPFTISYSFIFFISIHCKKTNSAAGLLLVLVLSCCRSSCSSGIEFSIKVELEPNGTGTVWSACGRG